MSFNATAIAILMPLMPIKNLELKLTDIGFVSIFLAKILRHFKRVWRFFEKKVSRI